MENQITSHSDSRVRAHHFEKIFSWMINSIVFPRCRLFCAFSFFQFTRLCVVVTVSRYISTPEAIPGEILIAIEALYGILSISVKPEHSTHLMESTILITGDGLSSFSLEQSARRSYYRLRGDPNLLLVFVLWFFISFKLAHD
jgi:hypothetical protein